MDVRKEMERNQKETLHMMELYNDSINRKGLYSSCIAITFDDRNNMTELYKFLEDWKQNRNVNIYIVDNLIDKED